MRTVRDGEGRSWRVWHVVPQSQVLRAASPDMAAGWLCFEHGDEKRRLASPPVEWEHVSDQDLLALLVRAAAVKKAKV